MTACGKKKLIFINVEINYSQSGTIRKARAQYDALSRLFDVQHLYLRLKSNNRLKRAICFYFIFPFEVAITASKNNNSIIYYRYYPHCVLLNLALYFLRKRHHIYVEVNTKYRYEFKNINKYFYLSNLLSERLIYRAAHEVLAVTQDFANYVHLVEPHCHTKILGNGYDPAVLDNQESEPEVSDEVMEATQKGEGKIKFIWVGTPFPWHGLDKILTIINSIPNSCLFLVGDYQRLPGLGIPLDSINRNQVFLLGERDLPELQFLYKKCDFALGSFALERLNITETASLKVREYIYYGLPVIIGHYDFQIEGCDFVHRYIDMKSLMKFISKAYDREAIKQYGRENLSWRTIMKNVFSVELSP